ncbi:hypothetical protein [Piscirickettsia salmonis]|uniref:hypothetical protein n=1 Tax=Piscirickettsia salmonis TaxID=1238 RepID=UPI0012BABD53|nr:hypothetical protein [Piscirickettsia salmonis]
MDYKDSTENHFILDGIFCDAYTRWGGAKTLIIPALDGCLIDTSYYDWLAFLDPDYIYSYAELSKDTIGKLNTAGNPIKLLSHDSVDDTSRWRSYIPNWHRLEAQPIKSSSTLLSPLANYKVAGKQVSDNLYITQNYEVEEHRFLPDNFGVHLDTNNATYGKEGVFNTIDYCQESISKVANSTDKQIHSIPEIMQGITIKDYRTFYRLASVHSEGICHPSDVATWTKDFCLFLGNGLSDRINFWNSRTLSKVPPNSDYCCLILNERQFECEIFNDSLIQFLNKFTYCNHSGVPHVTIRSFTLGSEVCESYAKKINDKKGCWSRAYVPENYNQLVIPSHFNNKMIRKYDTRFWISETKTTINILEPEHFSYITPNFLYSKFGQCSVDLIIERHRDYIHIVNDINPWVIPRENISYLFSGSNNISKINSNLSLTCISQGGSFLHDRKYQDKLTLFLPEDIDVFSALIVKSMITDYNEGDLRYILNRENKYHDICISDKGKNHLGIVAKFNDITQASEILANKFWRKLIRETYKKKSTSYSLKSLESKINTYMNQTDVEEFSSYQGVPLESARKYLRCSLADTLEMLVHVGIMQQVHVWKCNYCGHKNSRSLDTLNLVNNCDVCESRYNTPIDMEWEYVVSPFIVSILAERSGLTVLWAISNILSEKMIRASPYIPEVDLIKNGMNSADKNEVDFVILLDGKLVIGEVKYKASSFINDQKSISGFIDEINRIEPDVAYLMFEEIYEECDEFGTPNDVIDQLEKIKENIASHIPIKTKLKMVIAACHDELFKNALNGVGIAGARTNAYLSEIDSM